LKGRKMADNKESSHLFDGLLFPKIFQAFRMAIQPSKLTIGLLAVAAVCAAGWIMDQVTLTAAGSQGESGVFSTLWHSMAVGFHSAVCSLLLFDLSGASASITECYQTVAGTVREHYVYSIVFFAITFVVMCIAGGAICRIAALQFARGEKPGLTEAVSFSMKRFLSLFAAPLTPVGIIIFVGIFIFVLGLLGNIPRVGELLIGIFMPLTLLAGGFIAIIVIGAVAGLNLMFPAVAYDDADCFDAISRSLSYVYAKPWRMGFYTIIAAIYGAICYLFVRFFTFVLLWASHWALQLGLFGDNSKLKIIWPVPTFGGLRGGAALAAGNWTESVAVFLMQLFVLIMVGLVVSFIISFYFSVNTIIYALMRNRVDNTAFDDVYTYSDEAEPSLSEPEAKEEQKPSEPPTEPDPSSPTE